MVVDAIVRSKQVKVYFFIAGHGCTPACVKVNEKCLQTAAKLSVTQWDDHLNVHTSPFEPKFGRAFSNICYV